MLLQEPQWFGSVALATQVVPHRSGTALGQAQVVPWQVLPVVPVAQLVHEGPHAALLLVVTVQVPLQSVSPAPVQVQVPDVQCLPPVHCTHVGPHLASLLVVSVQVPEQSVSVPGQPHTPPAQTLPPVLHGLLQPPQWSGLVCAS